MRVTARSTKARFAVFAMSGALAAGAVGAPVAAAQPQVGVVNVNVEDVYVNAVVPVAVAANICNVPVNVLVADLRQDNTADCDADAGTGTVTIINRPL